MLPSGQGEGQVGGLIRSLANPLSIEENNSKPMTMDNAIRVLAGTMVLISISLAHWVSEWWLLLTAFVGVNLIQSAFTGLCPAEHILRRLGIGKGGSSCCGS